jgi:hypothetical protein
MKMCEEGEYHFIETTKCKRKHGLHLLVNAQDNPTVPVNV